MELAVHHHILPGSGSLLEAHSPPPRSVVYGIVIRAEFCGTGVDASTCCHSLELARSIPSLPSLLRLALMLQK